jgi:hypothetical protein
MGGVNGCVVKEELNDTYNQAHLGMNQWSLLSDSTGSYRLEFDAGYLVGLVDEEGVDAIFWRYELMTTDEELIALNQEEMRPASLERTQVFVEGRRQRELELNTLLREGDTYILWFTLYYNEEILHEQLFPITAGEEGSDPYWLEELIGERLGDDVTPSDLNAGESESGTEDTLEDTLEEVEEVEEMTEEVEEMTEEVEEMTEEASSDPPEGEGDGMIPDADDQND